MDAKVTGVQRTTNWFTVIFAGIALLSDGYQNNVFNLISVIFGKIYSSTDYTAAITSQVQNWYLVGTIIGQLGLGLIIDRLGRKTGLLITTICIILGTLLSAAVSVNFVLAVQQSVCFLLDAIGGARVDGDWFITVKDTTVNGLLPTFEWQLLLGLFSIPGILLGSLSVEKIGRKRTMMIGFILAGVFGLLIGGLYSTLQNNIGAFIVLYGLFLSSAYFGPGDCLGLTAAESFPTSIRGVLYGLCAAIGKAGAAVGTAVLVPLRSSYATTAQGNQAIFYLCGALGFFGAIWCFVFVTEFSKISFENEDAAWMQYLAENGWSGAVGFEKERTAPEVMEVGNSASKTVMVKPLLTCTVLDAIGVQSTSDPCAGLPTTGCVDLPGDKNGDTITWTKPSTASTSAAASTNTQTAAATATGAASSTAMQIGSGLATRGTPFAAVVIGIVVAVGAL
ncbi:hypothetical protein HDU84_003960 [Entophlyctis sp. JEL0112]|nr:hypothetical protein HDU84_003960 [Entophlyctis sp. JEL0112]